MRLHTLLAGLILLHSPLTFAAWREASSEHFVIYADESESDLRTFSEKLERFHKAMTAIFPARRAEAPSPSNRPTIYITSKRQVNKLRNAESNANIVGFYIPRAGNSTAFITPVNTKRTGTASESEMVLLQTYALHFKVENLPFLTPLWFTTGFGEYFANASFPANGNIVLGNPNNSRAYDLNDPSVRQFKIEELLDSKAAVPIQNNTYYTNFPVRSWSLFHYLYSNQNGREEIVDYLNRINRGESELDAARAVFGDLKVLDQTLEQYLKKPISAWSISAEWLTFGPVSIRELSEAEEAALDIRMQSDSNADDAVSASERTAAVEQQASALAIKYPDEPEVQAALAEAEYNNGSDEAAIAAADKVLAVNPNHIRALIQKGLALARSASETKAPEDWAKVRAHFLTVNKVEPEHPLPLLYFYLSYVRQGLEPTQNAVDGLEWALALAPYDSRLRMTTAQAQMDQKRYQDAIQTLSFIAFNPRNSDTERALGLLEIAQQELGKQSPPSGEAAPAP
jgi:tetratricopeptide (TPR) repeat protein